MTAYRVDGPAPVPVPDRGRRPVGAKVLLVLGAVMLLGAVIGFRAGAHRVVDGGRKLQERAERLRRDLVVELDVPGRTTVRLRPGRYNIYDLDALSSADDPSTTDGPSGAIDPTVTIAPESTPDPTATTAVAPLPDPTATTGPADPGTATSTPPVVTDQTTSPGGGGGPVPSGEPSATTVPATVDLAPRDAVVTITDVDGVEVEQTSPSVSSLADAVGGELLVQQQVHIVRDGTYTVEASGSGGGQVGVGPVESTAEVGRVVGGAFLTISSLIIGGLGVLALVGGLVWLLAGGRSSPPSNGPMASWQPAPPGGFGPGPPVGPAAPGPASWPGPSPAGSALPPPPPPPGSPPEP